MDEPLRAAGLEHLVELSANVEVQLRSKEWEPVKAILAHAREDAVAAMIALTSAPADQPDKIVALQNAVRRYSDLVNWLKGIVEDGEEADRELVEIRHDEVAAILPNMDDETKAAIGIKDAGAPSE